MKSKKASALVFALITLTAMMIVAIASYEAAIVNNRTATDTDKSVSSFQAADSGVELVMKIINTKMKDPAFGPTTTLTNAGLCNYTTTMSGRTIKVYFH